jgi:hypothetical protein
MNSKTVNKSPVVAAPEERRDTRERTFLPARIAFGDGGALSIQCTVMQLSTRGARLNVSQGAALPDRFDIAIPQRGLNYRARLIWRKDDLAGVEFEEEDAEDGASPPDPFAKIRELEAANAKLRARVSELLIQVQRLTEI